MKPEFKVGDVVHFRPYKERSAIQARVKAVRFDNFISRRRKLWYSLGGIDAPLTTHTTPRSIVESVFYGTWKD